MTRFAENGSGLSTVQQNAANRRIEVNGCGTISLNCFRFVLGNPIFPVPGPVEERFPYRIDRSVRSE